MNRRFIGGLSLSVAAMLLAACGGSQPPLAGPAGRPSWVLREAQTGDLLYVTSYTGSFYWVYMFSYPAGKLVGKIAKEITGLCSDSHGNVYMTQSYNSSSTIYEYAHAGKKPIATLSDPYNGADGCAVDPVTGNLAVANSEGGTVVVYEHARGKPKHYYIWFAPDFVAYDPKGHLFVLGASEHTGFAQLVSGQFQRVKLDRHVEYPMGAQWDGKYMALGNGTNIYNKGAIRQYTITGHTGLEKGYTQLGTPAAGFYIAGSTMVVSDGIDRINFFAYPGGGEPTKRIRGVDSPGSLTVSVAP